MSLTFVGRGIGLLAALCLCVPASGLGNAGNPKKSVRTHLSEQNTKMNEIYQVGKPTGRAAYLLGAHPWIYYWTSSPINKSDVKFGSYLMRVYNMYCDLKGHKSQCLSNSLRINYKISGSSRSSSTLYVNLNGRTKSSNSFQEIRSFLFGELERYASKAPISTAQRDLIQPAPRTVVYSRFLIHTKNDGSGNHQWLSSSINFRPKMLRQAEAALGNIFHNWQQASTRVKNDGLYSKNQSGLLNYYKYKTNSSQITAAVSSPNANDAGGMAWINRPGRPFIMKSCRAMHKKDYPLDTDLRCTARGIYLHEMAHVFGLRHCTTHPDKQSSLCTENFWKRTDGRKWLRDQIAGRTNALKVSYAY